uniref:Apple domain-containing protein n=1 Tax=Schistocephalus solidus TaxID=70667 RepID=A0A183TTB8_SCHSO
LHHCGPYCLAREPPPSHAVPTQALDLCAGACSNLASVCFFEGKNSRMPQLADAWVQLIGESNSDILGRFCPCPFSAPVALDLSMQTKRPLFTTDWREIRDPAV